jgi:hypothetical protein
MGFKAQNKRRGLGNYEGGEDEAMKGPHTCALRGHPVALNCSILSINCAASQNMSLTACNP